MRYFWLTLLVASVAHAASIDVRDAYVPQPPPGQSMAVMFLTLHNALPKTVSLVSARSEHTSRIEIHTHVHANGQMKMQAVAKVELPKGDTVFKPGGLHLMLFGLKRPLKAGDWFPITLTLSDGENLHVEARVRDLRQ